MDNQIFDFIVKVVVPVICGVTTYFIIPYIRSCTSNERLAEWKEYASLAVKCAEMLWTETGHSNDKKQYVIDFLNKTINKKKQIITEEQINVLIESAVQELNYSELPRS